MGLTLRDSCLNLRVCCTCNYYRNTEKWIFCPRNFALSSQKRVFFGRSLAIALQRKKFRPIFAAESENQTLFGNEESQINDTVELKTVRVRFKLHKECAFGQQFLIVGDDRALGLWDPSDGIPLNWSDGHVWSVELDLPIGKVINYKFIMKGVSAEIWWQPGRDRVLTTWETEKTITVLEYWDNPDLQMIMEPEEEVITDQIEESLNDSELTMVAENLTQQVQVEETNVNNEAVNTDGGFGATEMVANNISKEEEDTDLGICNNQVFDSLIAESEDENDGSLTHKPDLFSSRDKPSLFSDEGVPVLVPGLIPMPTEESQEETLKENNATNTIAEVDKAESSDTQEEERASSSFHDTGTSETKMINEEEQVYVGQCVEKPVSSRSEEECESASSCHNESMIDKKEEPDVYEHVEKRQLTQGEEGNLGREEMHDNVLESDLQWGRRTLQKFLANLGFL